MRRRAALRHLIGLAASMRAAALGAADAREPDDAAKQPWVPAPGTRRNISKNFLADVDPCPARDCAYSGTTGQRAVIKAWCGAAFAAAYGPLGAWVTTGGGHGDYHGNEVYAFALDTRRWLRLNDPYPGGPDSAVDYAEGEYTRGIPLASHTYQHVQYLPPSLGGGAKGSLLLVVSYAAGKGARGSGRAHACDLATGGWTRYSQNKASVRINSTSATCFDPLRNRFWRVPYGGDVVEYLDTRDRMFHTIQPGNGGNNFGVDHTCAYDPVRDALVVLDWRARSPVTLWVLDLDRPGRWREVNMNGDIPGSETQGMGLEWCPPLRCFVGYADRGEPYVRKLVPPERASGAWVWTNETVAGDPPVQGDRGPHMSYSRFRFAPSIASFIWVDGTRAPVQAWRLRGT